MSNVIVSTTRKTVMANYSVWQIKNEMFYKRFTKVMWTGICFTLMVVAGCLIALGV